MPVARVAGRPPTFVIIKVGKEAEPTAYLALPRREIDRLGEFANRLGREIPLSMSRKHVGRVDWSAASAVANDVTPDLEHPQSPDKSLVKWSSCELRKVVRVTAECNPTVPSELLRTRFRFGDHRQLWKPDLVPPVYRDGNEPKTFGGQDSRSAGELHRGRDIGLPKLGVSD